MTKPVATPGTLGTFAGVFTPAVMTIVGIILFVRLGFVVGTAGLLGTLAIIAIATSVSVLTSLSLSAIATNIRVRGGGDYYLISRTLGVEFGGALGVVIYLAQSVSVGFYTIGLGEIVAGLTGGGRGTVMVVAAVTILALAGLGWMGTDAATRFQYVIMVIIAATLLAVAVGAIGDFSGERLASAWVAERPFSFWVVFAIFFPAATGFTQGASMSGELRDPSRSLPLGTLAAVGVSTVIYVGVAFLLAGSATRRDLVGDPSVLASVSVLPPLVEFGAIASVVSSAMTALIAGPRILQSMAADRVFPALDWFSVGAGPANNPRRALLLTTAISLATVALGSVNVIAPVVSMFFLVSYGLLNYATAYEASSGTPSFRPRFRWFDRRLSWLGAALCLVVMLAINPTAAAFAIAVLWLIYRYLGSHVQPERWSDSAYSHYFQRAAENLRLLAGERESARNWRPQLVIFSAEADRGGRLLRFGTWIESDAGLSAVFRVVIGSGAVKRKEADEEQLALERQIEELGATCHPRVLVAPSALEALPIIVQSFGVGPLKANTALFGWPQDGGRDPDRHTGYTMALTEVLRYEVNGITVTTDVERWDRLAEIPAKKRRIDVWWSDDDASRLALLTAYLFTREPEWEKASIRLLADAGDDPDATTAELSAMLEDIRIDAIVYPVVAPGADRLVHVCSDAAIVMLPMRIRKHQLLDPFGTGLTDLVARLPLTATFAVRTPIDLSAGPETEVHARLVAAEERVAHAEHRLRRLESRLAKAEWEVTSLLSHGADEQELAAARAHAEDVRRRTLKARIAVDTAREELHQLASDPV